VPGGGSSAGSGESGDPMSGGPARSGHGKRTRDTSARARGANGRVTGRGTSDGTTRRGAVQRGASPGSSTSGSPTPDGKTPNSLPGADAPAPDAPASNTPSSNTPAANIPASDTPAANIPASDSPTSDSPARPERPRMPPVRLAPREELAAAARVAPLLRAAAELSRWASEDPDRVVGDELTSATARAAVAALDLTPSEVDAAWQVVVATGLLDAGDEPAGRDQWDASEVLGAWDSALAAILDAEDLDGLATALYTVGAPVRIDALFDAYTAAAGNPRPTLPGRPARPGGPPQPDEAAALSRALETLADLGVVELGTEETAGGLTVALSPLGVWGVHRRLRSQGWHVPVLGTAGRNGAVGLLMTLASCDAEDGEVEIGTWLAARTPGQAARELIKAAATGSPGLRGAAFAVLDRIGADATDEIRAALADPQLRAHAAVWLHEHDEEAELRPEDRTWLLVDLGAGLLEEADPQDVVAELLPDVPPRAQAEIVAGLWCVSHPGVIDLLTALSEHHPDPGVARAARKAAFKARSPSSSTRQDS
jgi:hypothetical protein